jgi:thiamine pyrophosphokinase
LYIVNKEKKSGNSNYRVFAMGAFGGRMDQSLAAIHVLAKYSHELEKQNVRINLMDKNSIMLLLKAGNNQIKISNSLIQQKGCGFFPISERVELIQTTGLKWNMGQRVC